MTDCSKCERYIAKECVGMSVCDRGNHTCLSYRPMRHGEQLSKWMGDGGE